jgi:hypothetical protein
MDSQSGLVGVGGGVVRAHEAGGTIVRTSDCLLIVSHRHPLPAPCVLYRFFFSFGF